MKPTRMIEEPEMILLKQHRSAFQSKFCTRSRSFHSDDSLAHHNYRSEVS